MAINISRDSLFKHGYGIKYITGWDNSFKREYYTGKLMFYPGNPLYIVDVQILADRDKLTEEDIIITIGESHNASDLDGAINKNSSTIYEICKSSVSMGFVLDLDKMKVVESSDFNIAYPKYGLHTLFMFENIRDQIFCLVNPSKNINDGEFYTWFISYIYSHYVCLTPRNKIENYAKKFLQAVTNLAHSGGTTVKLTDKATVLDCGLNDIGELLLPIPGNVTKRFEHLIESSIEQMAKAGKKVKK